MLGAQAAQQNLLPPCYPPPPHKSGQGLVLTCVAMWPKQPWPTPLPLHLPPVTCLPQAHTQLIRTSRLTELLPAAPCSSVGAILSSSFPESKLGWGR